MSIYNRLNRVLFILSNIIMLPPIRILFDGLPSGVYTLLIIILVLLSLLFFTFRIKRQGRKLYKSDALAKIEREVIISNEGIKQRVITKSETNLAWDDILRAVELKDVFILFISNNNVLIIPKLFFKTTNEIDLFSNIANKNLRSKMKRKFILKKKPCNRTSFVCYSTINVATMSSCPVPHGMLHLIVYSPGSNVVVVDPSD